MKNPRRMPLPWLALIVGMGLGFSLAASGCHAQEGTNLNEPRRSNAPGEEAIQARRRSAMVAEIRKRNPEVTDPRVLRALDRVPRHRFVPPALKNFAYFDRPWEIGHGQTISQPSVVALMTQLAEPKPDTRALDVGTGSGYQAAILADLVGEVFSIEIHRELADSARKRLKALGYQNVTVRQGDGYRGWPEHAPFDLILVAAAPSEVPPPLITQLAIGGRLVIPVGEEGKVQQLIVITRRPDGSLERRTVAPVAFVPMIGEAQKKR